MPASFCVSNTVVVAQTKALFLLCFLLPVMAAATGPGPVITAAKGFKAGTYHNRAATIATLSRVELLHASKAANIEGLLALANGERRLNLDEMAKLQAWERYNAIVDGDLLLLRCLKQTACEPLTCAGIARISDLHREVLLRSPASNLAQVNQAVGSVSEQVMIRHFESTGWTQISGQVGRSGIDGLFVKRNAEGIVREVLAVESKYNTGTLQPTQHGQQMSREWMDKKIRNLRSRQPDEPTYRRVEELVSAGHYRARLWTMLVDRGEIWIDLQRIRSASDKVDELVMDPGERVSLPPPIVRLSAPSSSFERIIVDAYEAALRGLEIRP
jgi:hypothetical protein